MPIEVRELVIRAVVEERSSSSETTTFEQGEQDREALIQETVDRVLRVLRRERER